MSESKLINEIEKRLGAYNKFTVHTCVMRDLNCMKCQAENELLANSPTDIAFLLAEVERLKWERDEFERVTESWMKSYDKLKAKYEPEVVVCGE